MCTLVQSYGNTGIVTISTANSNLDGSGTIGLVLTAGHTGTKIKRIVVKAQGNTSEGMVRLFIQNGGGGFGLYSEIMVPSSVQNAVTKSFEFCLETDLVLNTGWGLYASTQNA